MAEPIKHNDIIEIDKTLAGIKNIIAELKKLQQSIKDTAKTLISFQQNQNINTPGGRQATQQTAGEIESLVQKNKKLTVSVRDLTKEQVRLTEERRKARNVIKQEIAVESSAVGSLNRMRAEYNKLTTQYNNANAALRSKLTPQMQKLDKEIRKNEEAVGRHQRSVGRYQKVFANAKQAIATFAAGVVGVTVVIGTLVRGIKTSISTVLNFDQAMADVAAITRATDDEIKQLRESAKSFGGTTKFTASEVAGLQKELGKLGFTVSEILSGTGGILALAAATGEDLAQSAEVAGSTVRAFGLETSETGRVADVMARSFTGSALTLERFAVAMRTVAPVAKASNFTLEETTALLGSLANAGFDASMAGTATRNIFLNLANSSGELAKKLGGTVNTFDEFIPALIELRDRGVDLNTMLELTDKRSVAAFARFLEGAEFTREFADELRNAAGAAEEMAEVSLNTLKGDLIILKSAFQGVVIETKDTNEGMNTAARGGIQLLTTALNKLKEEIADTDTTLDKIRKQIIAIIAPDVLMTLITFLQLARDDTIEFGEAIKETSDQTKILTWEEQQQLLVTQELEKKRLAQIEQQKILLQQAKERWELLQFQNEAEQKLIESQSKKNTSEKEGLGLLENVSQWLETDENAELERGTNLFNAQKKATEEKIRAIKEEEDAKKKAATSEQKLSLGQSIIAIATGLANTIKAGFPFNIPLILGYLAQSAGIVATIKSVKFGEGGHGELGGERHSQGGTYLPGIGEAERGEYFGIINRQMTRKYHQDLPGIFDSLNAGRFHDIWSNANIQLQESIDPYTKKMYDLMLNNPSIYTDSHGDTVKEYPDGRKRIIRHG